jgi:hypothetical protein
MGHRNVRARLDGGVAVVLFAAALTVLATGDARPDPAPPLPAKSARPSLAMVPDGGRAQPSTSRIPGCRDRSYRVELGTDGHVGRIMLLPERQRCG